MYILSTGCDFCGIKKGGGGGGGGGGEGVVRGVKQAAQKNTLYINK